MTLPQMNRISLNMFCDICGNKRSSLYLQGALTEGIADFLLVFSSGISDDIPSPLTDIPHSHSEGIFLD